MNVGAGMTYYEELGIGPDASVPEIRQAYKLMARLLHPDAQSDPQLKAMAGRQMQRLGEIVAVLVDPGRRYRYDQSLLSAEPLCILYRPRPESFVAAPAAPCTGVAQLMVRYWFWFLI